MKPLERVLLTIALRFIVVMALATVDHDWPKAALKQRHQQELEQLQDLRTNYDFTSLRAKRSNRKSFFFRHECVSPKLYELIELVKQQKQENYQLRQRIEQMESKRDFLIAENQQLLERERKLENKIKHILFQALASVANSGSKLD